MRPDPDQTRRFLSFLMPPGTTLELRIPKAQFGKGGYIEPADKYPGTFSGWYDSPDALIADAGRARGVSAYVTLNPVNPDLLARSYRKLIKANHGTSDEDIIAIRWLFLDIDAIRPADISATEEELDLAVSARDRILWDNPEIMESSVWGRSGNGAWLLVRVPDWPNTEKHRKLIEIGTKRFAERYSTDRIKIDATTRNPSRIMPLAGTWKCKGSSIPSRPWRLATIDSPSKTHELAATV